jgi:hypothetical protein
LDRYAARNANLVVVGVDRMAVLGARSAPSRHRQPAKGDRLGNGISSASPWLVSFPVTGGVAKNDEVSELMTARSI